MRKHIIFSLLFILFAFHINAQMADDIIGEYHLPNNLDVDIFKQGEKYFGRIIRLNNFENGQKTDINNSDKWRQNDSLLGKVIIKNLEFDAKEKQWKRGRIYGAEKGLVLDFKITVIRKNEIEVIGSRFFFWKTLIWENI